VISTELPKDLPNFSATIFGSFDSSLGDVNFELFPVDLLVGGINLK